MLTVILLILACNCNWDGAIDCERFKGTCLCKKGVQGFNCEQCAPGYIGFPNCKGL